MRTIRVLRPSDSDALHNLHKAAFPIPWSAKAFEQELSKPTTLGLGLEAEHIPTEFATMGLVQHIGEDAELLTLATLPASRRQGLARHLLQSLSKRLTERGGTRLFLEVAEDNLSALALYRSLGFTQDGVRKTYYKRLDSPPIDAVLMSCALKSLI